MIAAIAWYEWLGLSALIFVGNVASTLFVLKCARDAFNLFMRPNLRTLNETDKKDA